MISQLGVYGPSTQHYPEEQAIDTQTMDTICRSKSSFVLHLQLYTKRGQIQNNMEAYITWEEERLVSSEVITLKVAGSQLICSPYLEQP